MEHILVDEIQVITGYNTPAIRDQPIFQPIQIDAPEIYYSGNYHTSKIAPQLGRHFQFRKEKNGNEIKIY